MSQMKGRKLRFSEALILLIVIVALLIWGALIAEIPTGVSIFLCAVVASVYGLTVLKLDWEYMYDHVLEVFRVGMGAVLILLIVGFITSAWMASGTTPLLIYYGLKLINPSLFLMIAFIITGVASLAVGSGWAIIGSFGVALMGVATGLGIPAPVAAASICAGSYVGDKFSPLSDVTNLSAAVTRGNSFELFKVMIPTEIPGLLAAIVLYGVIGFRYRSGNIDSSLIEPIISGLEGAYHFNIMMLLPLLAVVVLSVKQKPILPALIVGVIIGGVLAIVFQGMSLPEFLTVIYNGYVSETGLETLDTLLTGGGMLSMMSLILIIFCAFIFAGIVESMGMLEVLLQKLTTLTKSRGSLVLTSAITTILGVYFSSSVYVSLIINGRMWGHAYENNGMDKRVLGRTLTEAGSYSGAIVPWSGGAIIMLGTFGVHWYEYTPYLFNHWVSLACVIIFAYLGIFLKEPDSEELAEEEALHQLIEEEVEVAE